MKIVVRGISEETTKDELKVIIREFCACESVYAKSFWSGEYKRGYLRGVEIYPTGSRSKIGFILYDVYTRKPKVYAVIKRRQVVRTYSLK